MLYTLFLCGIYISFSLNEDIKAKNGYILIKILQNNLDEREIKFHDFYTFYT